MTMNIGEASRRQFLLGSVSGLSSAWLALRWPAILAAQEHAQRAEASGRPRNFSFSLPKKLSKLKLWPRRSSRAAIHLARRRRASFTSSIASWLHSTATSNLHTLRASRICDRERRCSFRA